MFDRSNEREQRGPMAPEPYPFLPAPRSALIDPPDSPTAGWWNDPLGSDGGYQRYYDGSRWTPYVRGHTPRGWTQIFRDNVNTEVDPEAVGVPRPPAIPHPAPDPATVGWWADPVERKLKQARFDGAAWTDLIAPTKSAGPRLVTRRRDPKEVLREQRAAAGAANPQDHRGSPAKRRWPWSRPGNEGSKKDSPR
jgi:hypothetical protein